MSFTPFVGILGFTRFTPGIDLAPQMPGCTLYTTIELVVPMTMIGGSGGYYDVAIPTETWLAGLKVYAQNVAFGSFFGDRLTQGLELRLGTM